MNAFTDESTQTAESPPAGARTANGRPRPHDPGSIPLELVTVLGAQPLDEQGPPEEAPPGLTFRIERGHAEPEELAALTVVLTARLAGLRALVDGQEPAEEERPADRRHAPGHHPHRSACWSGCWTCA
ncbi:acyl-CoA carboxylase subunit epsilon [Streptomyces sp. N2A]|uniref:acyl-CoA carboxylase subunit epsilon n=1 Tax=Streptomyces sp. N2A TaxID=3073936 RepID=UPI00286FD886|nr:acyl-CoA carboxylase subunit epsilon [Streptomyces sp. N2A]